MDIAVEKLIELVQARQPLYNYNTKDYNNKHVLDALWEEIGVEMKATAAECKNKWTVLRNSYTRVLREKRKYSHYPEHKKRKTWYLAEAMSFLDDVIKQNRKESEFEDSVDLQFLPPDSFAIHNSNYNSNSNQIEENIVTFESLQPNYNFEPTRTSRKSKFNTQSTSKVDELMISFLQEKMKTDETIDDPHLIFFKSLIPDLNRLSLRKQRKYKEHVLSTLNRFLDEEQLENIQQLRWTQCSCSKTSTKNMHTSENSVQGSLQNANGQEY